MAITLKHQTLAQFIVRLKAKWKWAEKEEKAKIATWIYNKYTAGDITANQIKNAFGFNQAQFDAFVSKITNLRNSYVSIQQETAE